MDKEVYNIPMTENKINPYTEESFRAMYRKVHSTLSCWDPYVWDKWNKQYDEWGIIGSDLDNPMFNFPGGRPGKVK